MAKGIVIAVLTGLVTWLLTRRKNNAEINKMEGETTETAVTIWREMAHDFKAELTELKRLVDELKSENEQLKKIVAELKTENLNLKKEIEILSKKSNY
ncbi:MAG: hypothetical protein ACEQSR_03780 [Candidatus Methylacidiphilales bacterium]